MNITNDLIKFTATDFSGLSEFSKKAITELAKGSVPTLDGVFEDVFSSLLNDYVAGAKESLKFVSAQSLSVKAVLESYANADAATRALAEPLLADLNALLNS